MLSTFYSDNLHTWDVILPYMNFVYNARVHRTTRDTTISLVHGQECQYLVDFFYPKPQDGLMSQIKFMEDLNRKIREAHPSARLFPEANQRRQKDRYQRKVSRPSHLQGTKCGCIPSTKQNLESFSTMGVTSEVSYSLEKTL